MKLCEVCEVKPAAFDLPDTKGKTVAVCAVCTEEIFVKLMAEKQEAVVH